MDQNYVENDLVFGNAPHRILMTILDIKMRKSQVGPRELLML